MLLKRIEFRNKDNFLKVENSIRIFQDKIYEWELENSPNEKKQREMFMNKSLEDSLKFYQFSIVSFEVVDYHSDFKYLLCGTDNGKLISFNFNEWNIEYNQESESDMDFDKDSVQCLNEESKGKGITEFEDERIQQQNIQNIGDDKSSISHMGIELKRVPMKQKKWKKVLDNMRVTILGNTHVYLHKMGSQEHETDPKVWFHLFDNSI